LRPSAEVEPTILGDDNFAVEHATGRRACTVGQRSAIVNEAFAQRYFGGGRNALGVRICYDLAGCTLHLRQRDFDLPQESSDPLQPSTTAL
jgi:hypothetical protein